MCALSDQRCIPCRGDVPPLGDARVSELLEELDGWSIEQGFHLTKTFRFPDFAQALAAVNRIGAMAEEQGHHPDIHLAWGVVSVEVWTHKINGLTESDFVFAAKTDRVVPTTGG